MEKRHVKMGRPVSEEGKKHTRARIFDAAVDLFSENGYEATSVRQIAETVSLTESAVYRHFKNKEAIIDAIIDFAHSFIFTPLPVEQNPGEAGTGSVFRGLLCPLPGIILSNPQIMKINRIIYIEMFRSRKIRSQFRTDHVDSALDYSEALFIRCMKKGTLRPCNPRSLARIFNAFRADWAFQNFIMEPEIAKSEEEMLNELEGPLSLLEEMFVP